MLRISFNSKLVRLKVWNEKEGDLFNKQFQFQTGSIKRYRRFRLYRLCLRFNSKLVRLKVGDPPIKSYFVEVSIPNWFD